MNSEELKLYEDELYGEDEDIEKEKEQELEEYLYSKVHYASKVDIVDETNGLKENEKESSDSEDVSFPEIQCTTSWEGILGVNQKASENKKKTLGAVVGEDGEEWDINEIDLEDGSRKKTTERYYLPENLPNIYCFNCGLKGHIGKDCSEERKVPCCYLCGGGHIRRGCPAELCFNCLGTGHFAKDCEEKKKKRYYMKCHRCRRNGHTADECTEIWRQYHCTTTPDGLTKPTRKERNKSNPKRSCYNCASKSHFGEDCVEYRYSARTVYSQFIVNYDECTSTQKSSEKTNTLDEQIENKGQEKDVERIEIEKEKEEEEKLAQSKKEKKKMKKERQEAEAKKLLEEKEAERERKKEKKEAKAKKILEEEELKKERKKKKKEEKLEERKQEEKAKIEQEEKSKKEKHVEREKRKRKNEESTTSSSPSRCQETKRSRKSIDMIKNNLWVSEDEISSYKGFSMKDHLSILPNSDDEDGGASSRVNKKKKKKMDETILLSSDTDEVNNRVKFLDESIVITSSKDADENAEGKKSTKEIKKKKDTKTKTSSLSSENKDETEVSKTVSSKSKKETKKSKVLSKSKDETKVSKTVSSKSKNVSNKSKDETKISKNVSIENKDEAKTAESESKSSENDEENTSSLNTSSKRRKNSKEKDKNSPRKLAARLDYESLESLKAILYSDDDENNDIINDVTRNHPIPDPQVHFEDVDFSDDDEDVSHDENDVSYDENDVSHDEESDNTDDDDDDNGDDLYEINVDGDDVVVIDEDEEEENNVDNDLTRYDPTCVYQDHLVTYRLIKATQNPYSSSTYTNQQNIYGNNQNQNPYNFRSPQYQHQASTSQIKPLMMAQTRPVSTTQFKPLVNTSQQPSISFKYPRHALKGLLSPLQLKSMEFKRKEFITKKLGINTKDKKERKKLLVPYQNMVNQYMNEAVESLLRQNNISQGDIVANRAQRVERIRRNKAERREENANENKNVRVLIKYNASALKGLFNHEQRRTIRTKEHQFIVKQLGIDNNIPKNERKTLISQHRNAINQFVNETVENMLQKQNISQDTVNANRDRNLQQKRQGKVRRKQRQRQFIEH